MKSVKSSLLEMFVWFHCFSTGCGRKK